MSQTEVYTDREEELIRALVGMAIQYLERKDGMLDTWHMSAGEECLDMLAELGIVEGANTETEFLKRFPYLFRWTEGNPGKWL